MTSEDVIRGENVLLCDRIFAGDQLGHPVEQQEWFTMGQDSFDLSPVQHLSPCLAVTAFPGSKVLVFSRMTLPFSRKHSFSGS